MHATVAEPDCWVPLQPPHMQRVAGVGAVEDEAAEAAALRAAYTLAYPALPLPSRATDAFLLRFLRGRKFNRERALATLHNYVRFEKDHPEIAAPLLRAEIERILGHGAQGILSGRDREGCLVLYVRVKNVDLDNNSILTYFRVMMWILDHAMEDPSVQLNGCILVNNMEGITMSKFLKMRSQDPNAMFFRWIQECVPLRLRGLHLVHPPWYVYYLLVVIKQFLSAKLQERIQLHGGGDLSALHARIDPAVLPDFFGGQLEGFDNVAVLRPFLDAT